MVQEVADIRANSPENIDHAARIIGKSKAKRAVFAAVCKGKQKTKTVSDLIRMTRLKKQTVYDAAKALVNNGIITQTKKDKETAYEKDKFLAHHKESILSCAGNTSKLNKLHTKRNPRQNATITTIHLPQPVKLNAKHVTIDDINSFILVRKQPQASTILKPIAEYTLKQGIQRIVGEKGKFKDWGGEKNDLFTTRIKLDGKRLRAAIAFKGKGTKGKLTPKKMGKNGDQIQRLFETDADLFLIQYWAQIDESVMSQMATYAKIKSIAQGSRVYFGAIDGSDTSRLIAAYPDAFI